MDIKNILEKIKGFIAERKLKFNNLKKEKKIALIIGVVAVILSTGFGISYMMDNKYQVLFTGLDPADATAITSELEVKKVETKIQGNSILVPREMVDKLRLELSSNISNGSKGFELMDQGTSFGLTDEEFEIKKQRMLQGELERTIKTFPQVESARIHITEGEESVFAKESIPGKAAIYLTLKGGQKLEPAQVRSIMSLVSASTSNIPKQHVEVVDQYMNLLSEGLLDENGNTVATNSSELEAERKAETKMNLDMERAILGLLEPIFGEGKVKAKVNADLNFDSSETTELIINPDRVAIKEEKSESKNTEETNTGGAVDNNMNNVANKGNESTETKEEKTEYEVGKTENKVVKAKGEVNKITASVAIDAKMTGATLENINNMVANTIGMDEKRGDNIAVVAMEFETTRAQSLKDAIKEDEGITKILTITAYVVGAMLLVIAAMLISMYLKKKKQQELDLDSDSGEIDLINKRLEEMENNRVNGVIEESENLSLEDEVKKYASENPEQITELINSWLNE